MKRFVVESIGCRTNQYEAEVFKKQLAIAGYIESSVGDRVDLCIVNACAITHHAETSSRRKVRALVRKYPDALVVVTGCIQDLEAMRAIPGVSHVIKEKERLVEQLVGCSYPFAISSFSGHTRAFLKVQDGCNNFCSYCIVPYLRGRSRSRKIADIVEEVKALVSSGHQEIVLVGVDLGDFQDHDATLADLMSELDSISGLVRLRLSSIHPHQVDRRLIDLMRSTRTICPSMHLVLQSGSNEILKRMRRRYTREIFFDVSESVLQVSPDFLLTTDIIVGFPGETEEDFLQTVDMLKQLPFAKVHIFPYSMRPGTQAATFPDPISPSVIEERKRVLLHVAETRSKLVRDRFVGRSMCVLTESPNEHGSYGLLANGMPVFFRENLKPNIFIDARIVENQDVGLIGEHIKVVDCLCEQ